MPTAAPSRIMLRHTRFIARQTTRRHASTTEAAKDMAAKSKETASDVTSKTSQGLSRVTSSAGPAVSGAAQRVSKAIGNIGGRTGRMISFMQCEPDPAVHPQSPFANRRGLQSFVHATMDDLFCGLLQNHFSLRRMILLKLHIVDSKYALDKIADW